MEEIHAVIPVSSEESAQVIDNSMQSIQQLEVPSGSRLHVHYVVDSEDVEKDLRLSETDYSGINSYFRELEDGTKAGALNHMIEQLDSPDYIAIFDVDSRPSKNFVVECKNALDSSENVFLASCPRKIINYEQNLVTKMAGAEFDLFNDIQYINDRYNSFNTFNGPISLIDGEYVRNNPFDEQVTCEDIEFVQEAYLNGLRTKMSDETYVGEQAPLNLKDLYFQKIRWMTGALESLEKHAKDFALSDRSLKIKMGWFASVSLPFFAGILSILFPIFSLRRNLKGDSIVRSINKGVALFLFSWLVMVCGLVVIKKRIFNQNITWKSPERENI